MTLTIEPGLYVRAADDVPAEFHDIGIRIEDDAIVTRNGCELITRDVPVAADEIEALMRDARGSSGTHREPRSMPTAFHHQRPVRRRYRHRRRGPGRARARRLAGAAQRDAGAVDGADRCARTLGEPRRPARDRRLARQPRAARRARLARRRDADRTYPRLAARPLRPHADRPRRTRRRCARLRGALRLAGRHAGARGARHPRALADLDQRARAATGRRGRDGHAGQPARRARAACAHAGQRRGRPVPGHATRRRRRHAPIAATTRRRRSSAR